MGGTRFTALGIKLLRYLINLTIEYGMVMYSDVRIAFRGPGVVGGLGVLVVPSLPNRAYSRCVLRGSARTRTWDRGSGLRLVHLEI